ncbi:MAG: prepilin peptidase [Alphaproteobacteria bacterium]|nr:prepilin peptidase [Alphaproteobacteria bacterium]
MSLIHILLIISSALFLYGAYVDYKTHHIPPGALLLIPVNGFLFLLRNEMDLFAYTLNAAALTITLLFISKIVEKYKKTPVLGYGDLILIFSSLLWISPEHYPVFLIACGFIGVFFSFLYPKHNVFPFVPAIACAWFLSLLWQENFFL